LCIDVSEELAASIFRLEVRRVRNFMDYIGIDGVSGLRDLSARSMGEG
jgi:hypothetical protein